MADGMINVKYTGNADPRSATEVINLGLERGDIPIEGVGQVTADEFNRLVERGVLLEVITKTEAAREEKKQESQTASAPKG